MKLSSLFRRLALLIVALTLATVANARAPIGKARPKSDPRVETILEDLDIKYEIDEDGDYRVIFEVEDGRSQLAFIRSATSEYKGLEVREILSIAYRSERDVIPADVATTLLEDTYNKKLGCWGKQGKTVVFIVRIDADADAKSLESSLMYALAAADEMEAEFAGDKDEF